MEMFSLEMRRDDGFSGSPAQIMSSESYCVTFKIHSA
jgi:hypothetical protein